MVGIQGIGSVPEPANTGQATGSGKKQAARTATAVRSDDVLFSEEARGAAEAARLAEIAEADAEMRAEQVARAKQNIEQGTYKILDVVRVVAGRISKYIG
ncbi:MAG: flagellar biosynthesis anti-sigma factor FlgM [Candidatus Hydrogenedentes bacterium]|nr:flagellar biosynthesis anti-sigma factor FlgM [Candidatus Hydrogenedentota bacterium]